MCDFLVEKNKNVIIAFLLVCPFILGTSVFLETNVGATVFILLSCWFVLYQRHERKLSHLILSTFGLIVSLALTFNLRPNAIVLVPVFIFFSFLLFIQKKIYRRQVVFLLQITAVILAIVLSNRLTDSFVKNSYSFAQPGFLWKGISVVQNIERNNFYESYFDYYSDTEENATLKALKGNESRYFTAIPQNFPIWACKKERTQSLIEDIIYLSIFHPKATIRVYWDDFLKLSGIPPLNFWAYESNAWSNGEVFGIPVDSIRNSFYNRYVAFVKTSYVFLSPWILFSSCSLFLVLHLSTKKGRILVKQGFFTIYFLLAISFVYNYAYLINAQSYEYRYSIPSTIILLIINLALLSSLINSFFTKEKWPVVLNALFALCVFTFFCFQLYYLF